MNYDVFCFGHHPGKVYHVQQHVDIYTYTYIYIMYNYTYLNPTHA